MAGGGPTSRGTEEKEVKRKEEGEAKRKEEEEEGGEKKEDEEGKEEVRSEEEDEATPASTATTTVATPAEDAEAASSTTPTSTAPPVVKQMPSSSRAMRNMAEKMRRDKLNNYIGELATLVPMVSSSPRRLDKTSVLRLSATYIRIHRTLVSQDGPTRPFLPVALKDFNFSEKVLDYMDGFLFVVMSSGKIVFVSQQVERLLGHTQNDLLGQSVYGITHADDHKMLASNLSPGGDAEDSASGSSKCCPVLSGDKDQSSQPNISVCSPGSSTNGPTNNRRVSFYLRMSQRAVGRGEAAGYEMVHIVGQLRSATTEESQTAMAGKGEAVMVAVAKVCRERQIPELSLMEVCKDEYLTRHGLNGEIINVDHRISVVAGYLADEVKGQSAFSFMHEQDARWTIIALQQMFSSTDGSGSSCYRLRCKTGQYIYLRTYGHCEFDRVTGKFETFVCINSLVSEEEGKKAVEEMKQRYSASIPNSGVTAPPLLDILAGRLLESPQRPLKALKALSEDTQDIASSSSSLLTITTNQVAALTPKGKPHLHHPGAQLTELHRFETSTEEIIAHTPKSFSSTSSPPPLAPVPYASNSPTSYAFDSSLAIEASQPLPYSPSKTSPRSSERQFGPAREGTCLPVPNTSSLKRPSDSPPHAIPSKRLHQSQSLAQQLLEPILPVNDPVSWPHMNCPPTLEATHLGTLPLQSSSLASDSHLLAPVGEVGADRDAVSYDPQLLPVEGSECVQPDTFLEDENQFSALGCNDLSSFYRATDIPDLREDLEILSMEVDPALIDQSLHQLQESDGGIVLSDNVVASSEEQSIEDTLHGGIQRSHQRLRLRLDSQGRTMASLERELSSLSGSHLIGGDLARLRLERKKQMRMLHTLEQEHRSTLATKEKTKSFSMQNVGV
nr:methoprene-tolerant protein [Pseudothemis zonata]